MTVAGSNEVPGRKGFEGRVNFAADTTVSDEITGARPQIHERRCREFNDRQRDKKRGKGTTEPAGGSRVVANQGTTTEFAGQYLRDLNAIVSR